MIIEKAWVKYDKRGNYDFTIESRFVEINDEDKIKKYIEYNKERDIEFYFYNTQEDVENNNSIKTIICNELI